MSNIKNVPSGSLTIFENFTEGRKCLAISWTIPRELCDPEENAVPVSDITPDPNALSAAVNAQVKEWMDNGTLSEGFTVAGHFIGGHLALALKKEFPEQIPAAYFFMGDTSGKMYGLGENGAFATDSCKTRLERPQPINRDSEDDNVKRLTAGLLALELLTACTLTRITPAQMKMDAEVDRLCAIDGGLKVYETVTLPPEKFNQYNQINFYKPTRGENTLGPDYIWKRDVKYLQPGGDPNADPRMWRYHVEVIRRADGRLLGEFTSYTRYGGDPSFLFEQFGGHSSHYSCPENVGEAPLIDGIFTKNAAGRAK